MVQSVFLWFYCLPIPEAVLLVMLGSAVFLGLKRKFGNSRMWKICTGTVLVVWMTMVIYATVISREPGNGNEHFFIPFHSYRAVLKGENPEILRSNFMNVVLFYPAGLLGASFLPKRWSWWQRSLLALGAFAALSAAVEVIQFAFALGQLEVDDVIHNSLGASLGTAVGCISLQLKKNKE